jgi:hypothetical protein
MPDPNEPILSDSDVHTLANVHQRFASSLLNFARANNLAAKDWVQGGWTRGKDALIFGTRPQAAPTDTPTGGG